MAKRKSASVKDKVDIDLACSIKRLPDDLAIKAASQAIKENRGNALPIGIEATLSLLSDGKVTPQRATMLIGRKWPSDGVNLSVSFLSNASSALKEKILLYMNKWSEYANINFTLAKNGKHGDVRISLGPGGYWSYLGTDIRLIPKNQPTMNLERFSLGTPDSEYERVVTHEVGHTLGMPHEHMRAELISRLDYQKTIAYFWATQGWNAQETVAQVLTPLERESIIGTEHADEDSVMCYQLPASITRDGAPIRGGRGINANDGAFVANQWPKKVTPPPEPDAPTIPDPIVIRMWKSGKIEIDGYTVAIKQQKDTQEP